jgi:tetratricopeptide (TPR) repeat protein
MPDQVNARINYANCLGKLERSTEAVEAYKAVLSISPDNPDAANKLAYFAAQACDWSEYNANFKRVAQILR